MAKNEMAALQRVRALEDARKQPDKAKRLEAEAALVGTWIERRHLEAEPELQQQAWIGYRYMTPLQRTELFVKAYHEAYIKWYARQFPEADIGKKRPINILFPANSPGEMSALWRARQQADVASLPYDVHLDAILGGHLVNDKWQRPPRPNQLYGKLALPRTRDLLTTELIAERLYAEDWDPRFFAGQYQHDAVQDAAIQMLQQVVVAAEDPARALGKYLCERHALTQRKAVAVFGPQLVRDALVGAYGVPIEHGAKERHLMVPGCFGHISLRDDASCQVCPVSEQCAVFSERVRTTVVRTTGSEDPRKAWKQVKARARQQRHRDKVKRQEKIVELDALVEAERKFGEDW
ncbi:hypothetical protein EA658_15510 [Pseudoxanthomonas winnipegensis]|jgi:hypothetical protein|uniref:Uncharacterized protein n=1 Tax=Pseudoxanthomonas winnipegensis TaxID=2480810 RepID=A0ABY1WC02_9GAMM|nr:hypothetical protein [Pseudoxanthomonas winnipegensis]TAA11083.1 hypothetical protein EA659_06920 [Pseudoxanthomonas winnipegensis]TAA18509.1 hypothetical protein EA658_15510 [Pseudoxanthomonas winnipegensis]TAH74115.1 hypothetical protein EA657_01235 [Pseudoxanthomonas winnipegensis]